MKRVIVIFLCVVVISCFFGCDAQNENGNNNDATGIPIIEGEKTTDEVRDEITVNGTYVGLIDNNSFEAIVDSVPTAFRHPDSPSLIENANISDGDSVIITYYQNEYDQNIVVSIALDTAKTLASLFPISMSVYKQYKGTGNEYAQYYTIVEFVTKDKTQIALDNSGTRTVSVYEVSDDYVKKVYSESEVYDLADYTAKVNTDEIILKTPIEIGTTWNVDDDITRTITAVDKMIETPYAQFKAVEVKTDYVNSVMYDYYVYNVGHVMSVFEDKETDTQIRSELESIEKLDYSK